MHQAEPSTPSEEQLRSITRAGGGLTLQNGAVLYCEDVKVLKHADGETLLEIMFVLRSLIQGPPQSHRVSPRLSHCLFTSLTLSLIYAHALSFALYVENAGLCKVGIRRSGS